MQILYFKFYFKTKNISLTKLLKIQKITEYFFVSLTIWNIIHRFTIFDNSKEKHIFARIKKFSTLILIYNFFYSCINMLKLYSQKTCKKLPYRFVCKPIHILFNSLKFYAKVEEKLLVYKWITFLILRFKKIFENEDFFLFYTNKVSFDLVNFF